MTTNRLIAASEAALIWIPSDGIASDLIKAELAAAAKEARENDDEHEYRGRFTAMSADTPESAPVEPLNAAIEGLEFNLRTHEQYGYFIIAPQCDHIREVLSAVRGLQAELAGTMHAGGYEYFRQQLDDAEKRATNARYVAEQAQAERDRLRSEIFPELLTGLSDDTAEFHRITAIIDKHYAAQREAIEAAVEAIENFQPFLREDLAKDPKSWDNDFNPDYVALLKAVRQLRAVHSGGSTGQAKEGGAS